MSVAQNLIEFKKGIPSHVTLVAVSKTHTSEKIMQAYEAEQRVFGENKVQEMLTKYEQLPKDIEWHLIGHLQTNKVKFIAPFVKLIHSVDSVKLLNEINKEAIRNNRIIDCLLQIYIANEETKFGFSFDEVESLIFSEEFPQLKNIKIVGLMGMATNTHDSLKVKNEFKKLNDFYSTLNLKLQTFNCLSMGMSSDYKIAIEEGSNMIRVGSSIFGDRTYVK